MRLDCMSCLRRLMMESILYHQAPWLGAMVKKHVLPVCGAAMAALGNLMYHQMHPKVRHAPCNAAALKSWSTGSICLWPTPDIQ